ncbi:MAG: phosphopantetheine-binding protein [Tannerella sp.]|jgi:acyl carrier protein|nr:phosphopantetheine-binding protein [Tannerella sp.]
MTREEIITKINDFLVEEMEIEAHLINDTSRLKEDLGLDSLDFVDIVVIVEKTFGFKIKAEEMAHVKIMREFYDYIQSKI